jgi:hypothetical protein
MGGKPGTTAAEKSLNQSGFGGWVDEKIEVPREAGPLLLAQRGQTMRPPKLSSTTFDNTSSAQWEVLLRQDPDANVPGQPPIGERQDAESDRTDNRRYGVTVRSNTGYYTCAVASKCGVSYPQVSPFTIRPGKVFPTAVDG